jgi:TRAP-type C4-dicarboxylate transport system permease small subunit
VLFRLFGLIPAAPPSVLPATIRTAGEKAMKKLVKLLAGTVDMLTKITGWIAALCLVSAAFIITEAVIVRKLFGASTIWQIEASVFLLIFTVFTGAAFVQKNEHHLNVDLVIIHLSPRTREITLIVVSIISCILTAILAYYAWPMWWEALIKNEHTESLWGPPMWIPYLFLPLGMTLLFLQYLLYIYRKIEAVRTGDFNMETERQELKK